MKRTSIEDAIKILEKEPIHNLPLISLLKLHPQYVNDIQRVGDSLIIRRSLEFDWTSISHCPEGNFENVFQNITDDDLAFDSLETKYFDRVKRDFEVEWFTHANMLILSDDVEIDEPSHDVIPLTLSDANIVNDFWEHKKENTLDYIKRQIESDITASIRIDKKPIAWGMTHDTGALGFLYVMEECRGRGYAKSVTCHLVNQLRTKGRTPFAFIAIENERSYTLAKKLGFIDAGKYSWLKLVK